MSAAPFMENSAMPAVRGRLLRDEPMSGHCSWRAGGRADWFFEPADRDDLCRFLRQLDGALPITWIGLGSNLLVRDGGLRGVVIAPLKGLNALHIDGERVSAEAGVSCARLAREAARAGLAGLDFLAGIPGTVGGALAMNAGAFGGETWAWVSSVEVIDRRGVIRQRGKDEFQVGYRQVLRPVSDEWFLRGDFRLVPRDQTETDIRPLLDRRNRTQPIGLPSCGSVFRNPPGDHAARLIESCGLKGLCIGGACVSEKHANFIINTGDASATDIELLIQRVRDRVRDEFGIQLIPEVHIIGEKGGES